ncbi:MAG: hypothetical protein JWQ19_3137 [Subtercola sp.]|nr:hypothetical protein [Subtercola sp.]
MIGWRRKAKAERENTVSAERLYDLVNQTLLSNFGPLGSYAITHRATSDTDDIFHTVLASSVAHNIVASLVEHKAVVLSSTIAAAAPLAPIDAVPVPAELAAAIPRFDYATAVAGQLADAEVTRVNASSAETADAQLA